MTDIDLTAAIRPTSDAIYRQLSGQYGDFSTPSDEEAEAVLKAALPHILAQVEAHVKPDRLDVMPTRDEIARIIWTAMEGGETEGRTDGPLDWDYAAADAVLELFNGKTEQEVRADMLDALIDRYLHGSRASHAMPDHVISWIRSQPEYKARYVGAVSG